MNIGESVTFDTVGSHTYEITDAGIYKLECWGSAGGDQYSSQVGQYYGGRGGYSKGSIKLSKGTILYIACGGRPYNGGGYGGAEQPSGPWTYGGNGGGATHIALTDHGTLPGYNSYRDDVLIVAGGGGGAFIYDDPSVSGDWGSNGGAGGGSASGSFGQGANWSQYSFGGSGGGWNGGTGGGGGSNYLKSTLTDTTSSSGVQSGTGKATLTLMEKTSNIKYGEKEVSVFYGSKEVSVFYGDIQV